MEMTQGLIEFNWSSLMILCNVFILYIILRKFFWEKIKSCGRAGRDRRCGGCEQEGR